MVYDRVAESVATSWRAEQGSCEPISQLKAHEREMAQKALELLLTAQNAFVSMF